MERLRGNSDRITRRGTTAALSGVLDALLGAWGRSEDLALARLRVNWREVAGPLFAESARPVRVDDERRLVVAVGADGAAAMELRNGGSRSRDLLADCREMSGFDFTDIIVENRLAQVRRRAGPG